MPDIATQPIDDARAWPITAAARELLVEEIARLRLELTSMTGQGLEEGIVRLPAALAGRRLATLKDVLDHGELVDGTTCVAIGCRVTLRDDAGGAMTYEVVVPGDGDPDRGRLSADSPLGMAILRARPGACVDVIAPAGRWSVTIDSVG